MTGSAKTLASIADSIRARQQRRIEEALRLKALFAHHSDADLRRLWDKYDGFNTPDGFCGEDIHNEMNRRGDGHYCAV